MGRGEAFTAYIGAELKGLIASRGRSAAAVARETGHSASALNRWLNGRQALPLPVLLEACDVLGVEPREVVSRAYARLGAEGAGRGALAGAGLPPHVCWVPMRGRVEGRVEEPSKSWLRGPCYRSVTWTFCWNDADGHDWVTYPSPA